MSRWARRECLPAWWLLASIATHALLMQFVPSWRAPQPTLPLALQVELREPPPAPQVTLPKPAPSPRIAVAPPARLTREVSKKSVAEARPEVPEPVAQPQPPSRAPMLIAAPPAPLQLPIIAESRQTPNPAPAPAASDAPRTAPTPVPAPVIPPRSDAAYLNNPPPAYPLAAKRRGEQGTVMVHVQVTVDGLAASVKLEKTSGYPGLDDAALRAVRSWRFVPARQGDKAVAAPFIVPVTFLLKSE